MNMFVAWVLSEQPLDSLLTVTPRLCLIVTLLVALVLGAMGD
jgi:hypothetical protein